MLGARYRKAIEEVKKFGNVLVSHAVDRRAELAATKLANEPENGHENNLIDSLLDHINDHHIVADAAMNYLSAG